MLLLSWLEALKTGFVRGHVRRQARRIDDASRWGTVWVAPRGEVLEDRALLSPAFVDEAADYLVTTDTGTAGLSAGDTVTWNPTGLSHPAGTVAGLVFGTNAFTSIQAAINSANTTTGDTINVAVGTYSEDVNVNKSVSLVGAQTGVAATGMARSDGETLVNGTGNSSSFVFTVQADNVTIDGFSINPRTPARDAINVRTANVPKPGDPTIGAYRSGVGIRNNWIFSNYTTTAQMQGIVLGESTLNATQSVNAEVANTSIEDNYINLVSTATTGGPRGIVLTNQFQGGSASILYTNLLIDGNTVFSSNIALFQSQLRTRLDSATITGNTFGNSRSGVSIAATMTNSAFNNNTIQDVSAGTGLTLSLVNSTASGNTIRRIGGGAAFVVSGGRSSDPVYFAPSSNSTISNNSITYNDVAAGSGVTSLSGLNIQPNLDGTGASVPGTTGVDANTITLSGNTFTNGGFTSLPAAAIAQRSVGKTLNAVNVTPNVFNGVPLTNSTTRSNLFAIADQIADGVDASNLGTSVIKPGNVYVTPNSFWAPSSTAQADVQRGVNTAAAGDIVNIAAGTYGGNLTTDKNLSFVGDGHLTTFLSGGANPGLTINAPATAVTIQNLTLTGTPPIVNNNGAIITLYGAVLIDPSVNTTNVSGSPGNDDLRVRRNGANVEISLDGGANWITAGSGAISIDGTDGNDTLTIELSGGDIAQTINFSGGNPTTAPGDKLVVTGGSFTTGTFNFTNSHDGSVVIGGTTINYTGLEPVSSSVSLTNVVLNYSTASETITVQQFGGDAARTEVTSTAGESVDFVNPTGTLTINAGDTGSDVINVTGFGTSNGGAPGSLVINGEGGTDSVTFSNTATITGTLDVTAETISQSAGALNLTGLTTLAATSAGNITLNQAGNNFSTVSVTSGNNVTLRDANALDLGTSTITGNLVVNTSGAVSDSGTLLVGGTTSVNAGANSIDLDIQANDFTGTVAVTTTGGAGNVVLRDTNLLDIAASSIGGTLSTQSGDIAISGTVTTGGIVVLQPKNTGDAIGIGGGAGGFNVSDTDLTNLSTSTSVTIGLNAGTGATDIDDIDLSGEAFSLTVRGGSMTLDSITLASNKTLTLTSTGGSITDTNGATANITIGGGTGTAILTSATGIGSGDSLETNIDRLSATATTSGNVQIIETNSLTIDNPVSATGGSVSVQATGTLTTTGTGTIIAGAGTVFLFANDMVLAATINGSNGVELRTATAGTQITLGTGATGLALSNTELNLITVGGSQFLTVGNSGAGPATIDSAITLTSSAPRLRVLTGAGISFTSTGALSVTSGVEFDGSTITTTSSATSVITAPSSVNLLARTTGIGSSTNPITLAGTSSLSVLTTANSDAFLTTGTASGVQSLNAGSGFVEFQAGTFNLSGSNVVNDSTQIRLNGGTAVLGVGANSDTIGGLTMKSGSVTGSGTLTSASTYQVEGGSISPILAGTTGAVGLTKSTGGTVSLSGANTFAGQVSITDGNLTLNNAAGTALANGVQVDLTNVANAVLQLNFSETIGALSGGGGTGGNVTLNGRTLTVGGSTDTTFGGALSGATAGSAFVKSGSSNLNLTGTSSVAAGTTVSGGTLRVNGSLTSNVSVTSPATLGGSGTITGNVSGNGTVAPGNSPGVLTITGNFTPTGTVAFEVNPPAATAGTDYDQIIVSGTVDLSGATLTFAGTAGAVTANQLVKLIDKTSGGATVASTNPAQGATVSINGNTYRIFYNGGDGNDVVLVENSLSATVFVDDSFTGNLGQVIADADLGTTGNQPAIFGVNAFTTIGAAFAAATTSATIVVNSGTYAEAVSLTGTRTLRITGPDTPGSVTVNSLASVAGTFVQIDGTSTLTFGDATNTSVAGIIQGSGNLVKQGAGTVTFSGNNTYGGTTAVNVGTLAVTSNNALGTSAGGTTVASGATLDFNGVTYATTEALTVNGGTLSNSSTTTDSSFAGGILLGADSTATVGSTSRSLTLSGNITDGAGVFSLTKTGAGTLVLSGTNTFENQLRISVGNVTVSGGQAIADNARVNLDTSGASLTLSASETINQLQGVAGTTINLGANTLTSSTGVTTTYAGSINGTGGLTKDGAGTLTLSGTNTFTGATTINGGILNLSGGSALSDSTAVTLANVAGVLLTLQNNETIGSLAGGGSTGGQVGLNSNTLTTGFAGSTSFGGGIGGSGGLTKVGASTFTLTGTNTFTGATTITAGSLTVSGGTALSNSTAVNLDTTGANFTLSTSEEIGSLAGVAGTTVTLGSNLLTSGGTNASTTFAGVASGTGGQLTKVGTGTLTLTGANSYTGLTTISAGVLEIGSNGTTGTLGSGNVTNNATLRFNRSNAYAVANNITGSGAIAQVGSGTTTLSGTNTAAAGTSITGGRLDVTGSLGSNVTVTSPGILGGTGTVTGNVTGTGTVAPGTSPGILNIVGTFGPVGTLAAEINGTTPGTQHDQVNVTGSVNLGGTTVLSATGGIANVPGQQLVLINNDLTDAVTGTFSGIAEGGTTTVNGLTFVVSYIGGLNGNDVTLTQAGAITITGTAGADGLLIQEETISGLDYISYYLNSVLQTRWLSSAVTTITVNAGDGNDTLTVNYGASGGFFAKNITYNGGNQTGSPGDTLVLDDTGTPPTFTTITHSFTNNSDGSVNIDGTTITYTGLEPITDNLDATNRVFTFTGANETITLTASGAQSMLDSTLGESVVFAHPTTSLTINSTNGTDTINLSTIGAAFTANVTINSNAASTVDFNNATGLDVGAGNVVIDAAGTVSFSAGSLTTTGNVTLSNVGVGGVTANAAGVDIAANGLTISSNGAVGSSTNPLRTSVATVTSASTTGAGSAIFLTETDTVTLTSVTTANGAITVVAGGTITATSVTSSTDADANDISITATTGNIVVGAISAGTTAGDVTLLATTGSVIDNTNDATTDVTGDVVTLTAANGVGESGGNGSLDSAANSLVVSVTGAGLVNLSESNAVTLTSVNTANGSITITAGGTITATSVTSTTDTDANDISITATTGNIVVGTISAGTTAGDVTLLATTGSILDNANDTTTDITGDVVTLTAANGVGAVGGGDSLDTAANSLDVSVTGSGLINLSESDAVTLADIDTANGSITILAGGAILATDVASTTDSDANDVSITATSGNVTVGVVTAGTTAGDVTIVATAGSIIDNASDAATDVTGDVVTLTAATGVGESAGNGTLDTRANSLNVSVTGAGLVNLSELDAVTLTSVTTANGPITITAGGTITATSVASLTDTDANDIAITATSGNVALGLVRVGAAGTDATAGDVTITATSGNITDVGNDSATDVQGDVVTLTASGDIGFTSTAHIDTRANSLVLSSSSSSVAGTHGTWINEFNAVTVTSASTTDGVIVITSAGTMTVSTVTAGNTVNGARNVNLVTTSGDVLLNIVSTTGPNASVVRISAAGGIVDNNGTSNNISSNGALLRGVSGIGDTDALETTVSNLAASNTTTGNINVTNTGAMTITSVTAFGDTLAGVTQTAGGSFVVIRTLSPLTVLSPVVNSGGGDTILAAEGALTTDDLTLSANVTASGGTGSINLFAGGDILQTTGTVSAASTGTVNLSAGENFNAGVNVAGFANGSVTQTDGAVISSVSGIVNVEATGSVNLASVSTAGDVNVSADDNDFGLADNTGAITDNRTSGEGAGFANIVGATVNLFAASGIGNGSGVLGETADIDINATNLNATNLTSNAIQIFELDSVALGLVDNSTRVVVIDAGASITDQDNATGIDITAGTIQLRAVTGIGGTGVNAAIETTAATVNATNTTSGGIFLNSLSVVNFNNINAQTTGNIELTSSLAATLTTVNADSGNIDATVSSGNLTVATSVTAGGAGDIDFVALSGNIVLNGTTTAAGDDVTMVSSGNITGNGLVTGNTFSGLASTGIGVSTGNRVQTAVSLIRMGVTSGSIFVNNTSASLTTYSLASPAGTGITASGVVDLTTSSDLTVANGALVVAGGTATLQGGAANGGATITLNDTVDGSVVTVLGGTGADNIIVNDMSATNVLNLDGQTGSDTYTINYGSVFMPGSTANIDVEDTSTGVDSDVININGTNAVDSFNVKEDAQLAGNFRTTITGGHTGRVNYFAEPLTTAINAGLTRVNVSSLGGQDFFFVAPSRFFEIFLFGGLPSFGPALTDVPQVGVGDTLDFDPYGNTFTIDIRTFLTDGGTPAFQGVSFSNIENVPLTPIGTGSRFFDFDRVDLTSGTGTLNPLPSAYSPLAAGYERVIERDLYIPTDLAYSDIMGRPGYSDPAKRYGWEVTGTPELMWDGRVRSPVLGYEYTGNTTELAASQFGDVVRDGNWSTDQNTNAIFRFEMPSANSWYLVSAKVGQRNGAIDQVRIRNASTGYLLAQNISTTMNNIAEVKFPVKTDANGVIRLQFEDAGGPNPWWFLAGLEVRPGKILSFGGPPTDLVADGQTIDTLTAYNLSQNAIVTINPTYGTAITTGAFPDVDPVMNGYQRPTEPDPLNPGKFIVRYTIQRPSGPGFAYIAMGEVSTSATGDVIGDTGSQEINYIAPPTRRFDFGTGTSPVQAPVATTALPGGYIGVDASDVYTSTSGYGWSAAVSAGDIGATPVAGSAFGNLLRDFNYATSARNFIIDLPTAGAGGDVYDLVAIVGDGATSSLANQTISVVGGGTMVSGTEVTNYSYNGGTWKALRFTVNRTGSSPLQLQFSGGASGQRWQINGLELRLAAAVGTVTVTPPGGTLTADGTTIDTFTVSAAGLTGRTLSLSLDNGTITAVNGTPVASADADSLFTGLQFVPGADTFTVSVRRPGSASTATLTVQDVTGAFRGTGSKTYAAVPAGVARLFDFGATTSVAPAGYTLVTPSNTYSTALGYGWQTSVNATDVATLSGTTNADLLKDSISAGIGAAGRFRVDIPNGTYLVTAVLGDPTSNRNGMQVRWSADGGTSYTTGVSGVTTVGGQFTHVTFPITVTGGNVLLEFSATLSPLIWRAASLEIRSAAGTVSVTGPAGPVAGDGTTDTYTVTGGTPNATYTITNTLGTFATVDADTRFAGVQVVADGAGSFTFQVTRPITSGTNSFTVTEVTGARTGSFATTYSVAGTRQFDFNATTNVTQAGFIGVRANNLFSTTVGYGWLVAQTDRDNGSAAGDLLRDGHIGTSGTFRVVATPGLTYTLTMQFRDTTTRNITITGEGVAPLSFTVPANTTVSQTINLPASASADGLLDLLVARTGTTGTFIINSLVVATPQLAEGGFGGGSSAVVSEADLADVIAAAKDRWLAAGLTPEQMLALNGVRFEISDLGVTGGAYVGLAYSPSLIKIDDDAAGWGWFIDSTPGDDAEFLPSGPSSLAALAGVGGRFDLLTVVMHELGNALKLSGLGTPASANGLMGTTLGVGTRRLPGAVRGTIAESTSPSITAASSGSLTLAMDDRSPVGGGKKSATLVAGTTADAVAVAPIALPKRTATETSGLDAVFSLAAHKPVLDDLWAE